MFLLLWISFFGLFHSGRGFHHQARHERTRYVSSRDQIYGENFGVDEKYVPFVHFWEKPLQVLESSMKIPKKLSSRPLFSWDIPIQISTYTPSRKISTPVTESLTPSKEPKPPDADIMPQLAKMVQRSRSDRAKASVAYPESFALIPTKKKKSGNRKKSIEESELAERKKPDGRMQKRKKVRKNRKGKLERRRKMPLMGKTKEMNDQVNEVVPKKSCEVLEGRCEHGCKEVNGEGSCVCFRGFVLSGERCVDINECETNNGDCNGKCVNTMGSRKCICAPGFRLVDGVCADINECLLRNGHGPCQDRCKNTMGSYYCTCDNLPGTSLSSDKHTCKEDSSCDMSSAGCSHSCVSVSGQAFCTCPDGLELGDDWKTCHDIDECLNPEDHDVRCELECVNTLGSYTCNAEGELKA